MSDSNSYGAGSGPAQPEGASPWAQQPYGSDQQPQYGQPQQNGQPQYEPQDGQPQYGQPPYGQTPYGQNQAGQPQNGQPQYGQAGYGQPGYGQSYGNQQPPQQYAQQSYGSQPSGQQAYGQLPAYGQPGVPYVQPGASPYGLPSDSGARKWSGVAIAGLFAGLAVLLIGLFSGFLYIGILPIALCIRGLVDTSRNNKKGKPLAIIGLVLAGLGIIVSIINLAVS